MWKTSKNDFSDRECPNINENRIPESLISHQGCKVAWASGKLCILSNGGKKTIRVSLQGCKDVCMEKQGCTGFNYNHKTRSCVMRGCSLPVEPPARNYNDRYDAFWLASGFWRSGLLFACTLRPQNGCFCEFLKKPPLIIFWLAY